MIELFKTLIADFHARGVSGEIFPRDLEVPLDVPKIISVIGPRRAGKTCFMFSLIRKLQPSVDIRRIIYVNFEDERLSPEMETPSALIDAYQQMYPDQEMKDVYFFLDEIQEMKGGLVITHWISWRAAASQKLVSVASA
jgi:predicted AAA+ superfamily ATPase